MKIAEKIKSLWATWWATCKAFLIKKLGGFTKKQMDDVASELNEWKKAEEKTYSELSALSKRIHLCIALREWTEQQIWMAKKRVGLPPMDEEAKKQVLFKLVTEIAPYIDFRVSENVNEASILVLRKESKGKNGQI